MVVKSLETLVRDTIATAGRKVPPVFAKSEFAVRCQPTQIIDLMWQ